ncbi:hypothetical protein MLD38_013415 [Melastoma candidum]|uniref:Uncharacterized protein n=1 Tax=Melastoma candidum TaxID=119954 RepID=A0ACB9RA41_9MYRT|nr:hypothetical protein MLD38_013415 [Melastoma candidum]
MVAPTPDSSLPPRPLPLPTTAAATTATATAPSSSAADDDALKSNTDCVYFLASPLTCKKGAECEYRHSEYACVNPRDCWYWLNGNCLNPKCAFRHPPLDGLLGTPAASPMGVVVPQAKQSSVPSTPHASNDSGKQAVPCIFFQKGYCMKGDRCSFLHGISPTVNKTPQSQGGPVTANSFPNKAVQQPHGAGPSAVNSFPSKTMGALQKCSQYPTKGTLNLSKPTATPVAPKTPVAKVETVFSGNAINLAKNVPAPRLTVDEFSTYRPPTVTHANGSLQGRTSRLQEANIAEDYDTYKEKEADEFLKESSPGFDVLVEDEIEESDYYHNEEQFSRSVGHGEYDMDPAEDHGAMSELDHHERNEREYGWAQHRDPSVCYDGQAYSKGRSPGRVGESDLRHRLSKQRRVSGLRLVISHTNSHEEDRGNRVAIHSCEGGSSSRLKGRIKFPERSDAADGGNIYQERELDARGRHLSGGMFQGGRFSEWQTTMVTDGYNGGGRSFNSGGGVRSELGDDNGIDFAGPKSLAELKGMEAPRKALQSSITTGGDASFEGPKPLSVLLKRKRGSDDGDQPRDSSLAKTDAPLDEHVQPEYGAANAEDLDNDDGVIMEDGYEEAEVDVDGQEGGEYYEEQDEEGDYPYNENENVEIVGEGEEYLDDDDEEGGGDFTKKVGVMFS